MRSDLLRREWIHREKLSTKFRLIYIYVESVKLFSAVGFANNGNYSLERGVEMKLININDISSKFCRLIRNERALDFEVARPTGSVLRVFD